VLPDLLAMLTMPPESLLGPMPNRSESSNGLESRSPFLLHCLGHVTLVFGDMILARYAFEIRRVVVERISVLVMDVATIGNRAMKILPSLLMESAHSCHRETRWRLEVNPIAPSR
jgi:hypothetical protein